MNLREFLKELPEMVLWAVGILMCMEVIPFFHPSVSAEDVWGLGMLIAFLYRIGKIDD